MLTHNLTHFINLFTGYTKELSIPEPISNQVIPAPDNDYGLIMEFKDYLFSIFSETTNSDACSHIIEFDTDHGTMPGEEGTWNLTVRITDYLS